MTTHQHTNRFPDTSKPSKHEQEDPVLDAERTGARMLGVVLSSNAPLQRLKDCKDGIIEDTFIATLTQRFFWPVKHLTSRTKRHAPSETSHDP